MNTSAHWYDLHWTSWILICWLAGVALYLIYLIKSTLNARFRIKHTSYVEDSELSDTASLCSSRLGLDREIRLKNSDKTKLPFCWGWMRPIIVLPRVEARWSQECREHVLLHEMAHVKRLDVLSKWITLVATSIHWFNPLVWIVGRKLLYEQEYAADDCVLSTGVDPAKYASSLLEVAQSVRTGYFELSPVLGMACQPPLDKRIPTILDKERIRAIMSLSMKLVVLVAALALTLSLAWAQSGDKKPDSIIPEPHEIWVDVDSIPASDSMPSSDLFMKVDEVPQADSLPAPMYPEKAHKEGIEGDVWVRVLIDKEGNVRGVIIEKESGSNAGFEEEAKRAAFKGKWTPAIQNNQPVACWVSYKVSFALDGKKK